MAVCRQCGTQWPEGYVVCPDDGMRLSVSTPAAVAATGAIAALPGAVNDDGVPPGSRAGEYVIEKKLGEGGMGAVYGARHPVIGKRAAIKVIKRELSASAEAVDRFVLEAQAVNTIGHPNIVDVFGFGTLPDGRSFFVMEWLDGESLRARMERPLAFANALEVLESIAAALQAAHEAGVVHRDLKPDNVFLARVKGVAAPHVKLLDFGLAKLHGAGDDQLHHTRTGVVMGTPLYLSPEQAKGTKVDPATDIYSLGVMAYEMAAGEVPFMAGSAVEIMARHISDRAEPLSQRSPWIPPAFEQLVSRMLEKEPHARPAITEVVQQLQAMRAQPEIAGAAPGGAPGRTAWTPPPADAVGTQGAGTAIAPSQLGPPPRKRRGVAIGAIAVTALAVAGAVGAAVVHRSSRRQDEPAVARSGPSTPPAASAPVPAAPAPTPTAPAPTPPAPASTPTVPTPRAPTSVAPALRPMKRVAAPGTLTLAITGAPHATVAVDGKIVARDVSTTTFELPAGSHVVRVEAPGRRPWVHPVRVAPGSRRELAATLEKQSINRVLDPF